MRRDSPPFVPSSGPISTAFSPRLYLRIGFRACSLIGICGAALVLAVFCALRLARFNAKIDEREQPHKSAGFLTGVPAPAGAALALLPLYLWFCTDQPVFASPYLVGPWTTLVAMLMVSSVATYSWSSFRLRRHIRFEAIAMVVMLGAALVSAPWHTLTVMVVAYLATIPFSIAGYTRIRRLRATG